MTRTQPSRVLWSFGALPVVVFASTDSALAQFVSAPVATNLFVCLSIDPWESTTESTVSRRADATISPSYERVNEPARGEDVDDEQPPLEAIEQPPLPDRLLGVVAETGQPQGGDRGDESRLLGGVAGDFDGDGDVDLHDYIAFQICMSFSSPGFAVPTTCGVFDFDGDGDIDLIDMAAFENAFNHGYAGVLVDAGNVPPQVLYFDLHYYPFTLWGNAAQAGFDQDDLWYEWSVISQPPGSGQVVLVNGSSRIAGVTLLVPLVYGEIEFELRVTNLVTLEFGLDQCTVELVECLHNPNCDNNVCFPESCVDRQCVPGPPTCQPPLVCCVWCEDLCVECLTYHDCDEGEACRDYQCVPRCEFDFQCDDDNACTIDHCDTYERFCTHSPLCSWSDDLICVEGECYQACAVDSNCDDHDPCSQETCTDGRCVTLDEPTNCDDGDLCTVDSCTFCEGCRNISLNCSDLNPCTDDSCDPVGGGCVHQPVICPPGQHCNYCAGGCVNGEGECEFDADCDDGLFCNGQEVCVDGFCESTDNPCNDDGLFCNGVESCDESTDSCVSSGNPCIDDELCDEILNTCHGDPFCLEFTLAVDVLTGTSRNDCIEAPLIFNPPTGTLIPSLQTGDAVNGWLGVDSLEALFNYATSTTIVPTLTSVENLTFTDIGTAATTLNGTSWTGVTSVGTNASTNTNALVITNLPNVADISLANTSSGLAVGFQTAALVGTMDSIDLSLSNAGNTTTSGTLMITSGTTNGVEMIAATASGSNVLTALTQNTGNTLATLTIGGTGSLQINSALDNSVTTVNASANTGGVTIRVGSGNVAFTGGSGNDWVTHGANYASTDTINGGDGNDTLNITTAVAAPTSNQINVTNIEALTISDSHTTSAVLSRWGAITTLNLPNGSNAGSALVASGNTVTLGAQGANSDSAGSLTLTISGATFSDTVTLAFNDSDTGGAMTFSGIEFVNLQSNIDLDGSAADGGVNLFVGAFSLPDSSGTTLTITGTEDVTFLAAIAARVINASTFAQKLTMTLNSAGNTTTSTVATGGANITGGSNDDVLIGSTSGDSITGGTGNDTIQPGRGIDTVSFGTGRNILDLEDLNTAQVISANRDTASGFDANGTPYDLFGVVDGIRFANVSSQGNLSDGANVTEVHSVNFPANVTVPAGVGIVELAWEFTSGVDLAAGGANQLNGTSLLSGCGALSGATACTFTTNANDEDIIIIAYQTSGTTTSAFIYHGNGAGGNTALVAGEIALIAVVSGGVTVGGFDVSQFIN